MDFLPVLHCSYLWENEEEKTIWEIGIHRAINKRDLVEKL